jgi:hypothetical protein
MQIISFPNHLEAQSTCGSMRVYARGCCARSALGIGFLNKPLSLMQIIILL